jgi:HK97 family phage portal protein
MWPFKTKARPRPSIPFVGGQAWMAGYAASDAAITPRGAENLAAVLCAVNAISETVASLPAYVVRRGDLSNKPVPTHPLQRLIDGGVDVNGTPWATFLTDFNASVLLRGNAAAAIIVNDAGRLTGLRPLQWQHVVPWIGANGALRLDYTSMLPPDAGKRVTFIREDFVFMRDRSDDGVIGVPRLQRAAAAVRAGLELQSASATMIANAARPGGYLTAPSKISPETATRLGTDFDQNYRKERTGKTAVLGEGLEWKPLSLISADDMQIINAKNFTVADVARVFGVPPWALADPTRATYASAREAMRQLGMMTIAPWASRVEAAFDTDVLSPEFHLHVDLGALMRADPEARWVSWQRARQAGILTANEIRADEGYEPSSDPLANSLAPPNTSAAAVEPDKAADKPADTPNEDDTSGKAAPLRVVS